MTNNIETAGYWHFNTDTEKSYAGSMITDNGDTSVTLLGCYDPPNEPFTIYGLTATGKKITLYKCFAVNRIMSSPGISSVSVLAAYYIVGAHLPLEELRPTKALLKLSSLNEWVGLDGFEDFINEKEIFSVKYKKVKPITFYKTDRIMLNFEFHRYSPVFFPSYTCTVKQDTLISIDHKETFDLDKFWSYLATIRSFLTLAYFSEPQIEEINFIVKDKNIEFFYAGNRNEPAKKKSKKRGFLFTYQNIESNFSLIFQNWAQLYVDIEPVINILQECFSSRSIVAENRFLNVMQGIETFHRRRRRNEKETKDIHKSKIQNILDSCPEECRLWLKGRLAFSNEPTLNERLVELFKEIDTVLYEHLFKDSEAIIKQSKNNRNYYTHYDKSLEKKALKGSELFHLTERLKIFLLIVVLKESLFNAEQINKIILDGSHYLFNHLIAKSD